MKELFTPSKGEIFTAVAPVAYEHSRAARVLLRMFFFLPMSIVGGTILPMFLFKFEDWSVWLFLPFMIAVPVLTFFILGEHPEDRAIREAQATAQTITFGQQSGHGDNGPRTIEEIVERFADGKGISFNQGLAEMLATCAGVHETLRGRRDLTAIDVQTLEFVTTLADQLSRVAPLPEPRIPRKRRAVQADPMPQAPIPLSKNQQRKLKRRLGLQHQLPDDRKRRKP